MKRKFIFEKNKKDEKIIEMESQIKRYNERIKNIEKKIHEISIIFMMVYSFYRGLILRILSWYPISIIFMMVYSFYLTLGLIWQISKIYFNHLHDGL